MTTDELFMLARGIVRVSMDSTKTEEIHMAEELTAREFYQKMLPEFRKDPQGRVLLEDRPELKTGQVDFDYLRSLPGNTLGKAYMHHLDDNHISADFQAAPTTHVDDPDVAYMIRRYRQTHDVWHALLGLGIRGHEEVLVHAFSLGQLMLPVSVLVVLFGTFKHIIGEMRWDTLHHSLLEAYQNGRAAKPLLPVYWEKYWKDDLEAVRERFNIHPSTPQWVN